MFTVFWFNKQTEFDNIFGAIVLNLRFKIDVVVIVI